MPLHELQNGRYRLLQLIKRGMAEVYLAEDTRINNRRVAIKVVQNDADAYSDPHATKEIADPDPHATKDSAERFQREITAIGTLSHPHILPLFDSGEEIINGIHITYLVMPYCSDGSLANWLRARTGRAQGITPIQERPPVPETSGRDDALHSPYTLTPQDVASIVNQAAEALQYAHDRQIVHRDVKPSNFLIFGMIDSNPNRPNLLLADFGIVKFTVGTRSTIGTMVIGTPLYMSPEQWTGQPVPASDQYSLAAMAYELLTGRPPFQGGPQQLMYQHVNVSPQPPSTYNPNMSRRIDIVLLRALSKHPQDRFPSVSAFAQAFQQATVVRDAPPTPLPPTSIGELRATLSITPVEAAIGCSRTLTLPGGREVNVLIPAGVYNGQVLHLEGLGERSPFNNHPGPLILTLVVTGSQPNLPPGNGMQGVQGRQGLPQPSLVRSPWRNILLVGLVLLVILASVGGFLAIRNSQIATDNANATATANVRATGTTQANKATATITAFNATATAIAFDPYAPHTGKLVLNDPLLDNSKHYEWHTGLSYNDSGEKIGDCEFTGEAYDITALPVANQQPAAIHYCTAKQTDFSNFAYEVKMTIVAGDYGGIIFRITNSPNGNLYLFRLSHDGTFAFIRDVDTSGINTQTLDTGRAQSMHTGLNQSNVIAVVANGGTLDLYVNNQKVDRINDSTYSEGQIGVFAGSTNNSAEVTFNDARVWVL